MSNNNTGLGWQDLLGDIVVRGSGLNDPSFATIAGNMRAYEFPGNAMKEVFIRFHIPHDYEPGTKMYLHTHWCTNTAGATGNVEWGFEYAFAKSHNQAAFNFGATTVKTVVQAVSSTQYQHQVSEVSDGDAINTVVEPDGILYVRVYRDGSAGNANDTCTASAFLFTADVHYQSTRINTPGKAPNFYNP